MPTGGCYDNCEVKIGKTKIKKKYYGEDDITIKNFNNELKVYKLAKKNKISYIPKLISYSKKDMELVIEKTGISLKQYLKENKDKKLEDFIPQIKKVYNDLIKKYNLFHNDLRKKNILIHEDNIYLIDFENSGPNYNDKDEEKIIEKLNAFDIKGNRKNKSTKKNEKTKSKKRKNLRRKGKRKMKTKRN